MNEVLVLFSGGKDSFLSTLLYLEKGYKVILVSYDNCMELNCNNIIKGAKRIQKKYGKDKVEILGIKKIDYIWRELIENIYNYDFNYIVKKFGNITISQINCLTCRLAMYIMSIIICKNRNINIVVDGARICQLFAIEQEKLILEFINIFKKYSIDIEYPLLNEFDDFKIKNSLLSFGFTPKMNEAQCLLGMPLKKELTEDILNGCNNILKNELSPQIDNLINLYLNRELSDKYE